MRDSFLDFTVPTPNPPNGGGSGTYVVSVDDAQGRGSFSGYDYFLWAKKPGPILPVTASQTCPGLAISTNGSYSTSIPAATRVFTGATYASCVGGDVGGSQVVFQLPAYTGKLQVVETHRSPAFGGKLMVTQVCPPAPTDCLVGGAGADGASGVVFDPAGSQSFVIVQGAVGTGFLLEVKTFPSFE